jgi:hypothetical protein
MTVKKRKLMKLEKAVAYYLYIASKEVPDGEACLFRAAALALIREPVDAALLKEAGKRKSDDNPLYSDEIDVTPRLEDFWLECYPDC